ncbi:MAG: hypothetical protein AAF646_06410 [Pseudomonadota bacterium]
MSFLRPEALATLTRWRELALTLAAAAFGLWVATWGGWFYGVIGAVILTFALGLALTAWRRLRFAAEASAPGIVRYDEGAIAYFGPETGGLVALSEVTEVRIAASPQGPVWRIAQEDGRIVAIPVRAAGADKLFDTFAALPGASARAFLSAVEHPPEGERRVWQRADRPAEPRLPG